MDDIYPWVCTHCGRGFPSPTEARDHIEAGGCPAQLGEILRAQHQASTIPRTPTGTMDIPALLGARPVAEVVAAKECRHCGAEVDLTWSNVEERLRPDYAREYNMSGLCAGCQDEVFAPAPEDEEYNQGEMP